MSKRLDEYRRLRRENRFGWVQDYEADIYPHDMPNRWPCLAGWYAGMLEEALVEFDAAEDTRP